MKDVLIKNTRAISIMIFLFFFVSFSTLCSAKTKGSAPNRIIQKYLKSSGLQVRIVSLDRQDGFNKGISISGPEKQNVLIGFNQSSEGRDGLFLIVKDGAEVVVSAAEGEAPQLIQGNVTIDIGYIFCVIDAVLTVINDVNACSAGTGNPAICNAQAALSFVTSFLNCGEPATTP